MTSTAATVTINLNDEHEVAVAQTAVSVTTNDGVIDAAWNAASFHSVTQVNGVVDNAADLSAQWKSLWDVSNLYILVDVQDALLVRDSGGQPYMDDLVELFIDADNSRRTTYDGVNDFQYGFRYNDPGAVYPGMNSVSNTTGITFEPGDDRRRLLSGSLQSPGQRLESQRPWLVPKLALMSM